MPSRNLVYEVLALRSKETPAGTRVLTMLSAESGLVDAFVFGGPKSKLRSLASPWGAGRAFLYHDPVRDYMKLSDFEVIRPFSGLRENLRRILSASLVAELLIKTSGGGGDFARVLAMSLDCLGALEELPEARADYPLLLFIWRLVELIGILPETESCALCGRDIGEGESRSWMPREGGFACPDCRPEEGDGEEAPRLSAGALKWLARAQGLGSLQAAAVGLDQRSRAGLRRLCFGLAREAVEGPLESLASGIGVL
ncbi:MAG TPA: DNA repair protein RecO C-terminal domain-containing protein [Rectinemataceae bacterium]|nr:DNA repair protein RecO C-terminal domain-containing protein [Rectinemataceae bacterium]